ncbi:protein D3-like [Episyrphus balteatus]|uniref:protein D3-like n=1 Tax=Episyrphus balteatus TaxID=286459 RepID=UPI0024853244|nr:protein D3-like [Episyrphus balteatus]
MGLFNLLLCFILFGYTFGNENLVKSKMEEYGVVPDVVNEAPKELLEVIYSKDVMADLGNELTPKQVKYIPELDWNADENSLYTILLTDPDAPGKFSEFRHWLIVNIPGKDISKGKIIYDYVGAGPPKGTGLHRYIFLVFKQPNIIENDTFVPNSSREGRPGTKARDLIKDYNLGIPIAGNFFRAQFDDYVPILHAQLGGPPSTTTEAN